MGQNNSDPKEETDNLFGSSIYLGVGYGYGYNTAIWADFPYSAITAKAGNRWKLKGSIHRTYNFGIQFTWLTISMNKNLGQQKEYFPLGVGFAGIGISNMFRARNNLGFEVNINLIPHFQQSNDKSNRYFGPMANLELRMRYNAFYISLDSGISININTSQFILGGYTGLKLGFNLFVRE